MCQVRRAWYSLFAILFACELPAAAQFCGLTAVTPALSCRSAFTLCGIVNRTVWVQPSSSFPPYVAYCADGGWALAVKVNGSSLMLSYFSGFWTNGSVLNANSTNMEPGDAILQPFIDTPFEAVRLWMAIPNVAFGSTLDLPLSSRLSLRELISASGPNTVNTSVALTSWSRLVPGGASRQGFCNRQGLNVGAGGTLGVPTFNSWW
jgi:hypothetical protein